MRKYATVRLKEIRPDGQIWFWYAPDYSDEFARVRECLAQAQRTQGASMTAAVPQPRAIATETPSASAPTWRVGDEWAIRWESPRGSGLFVWRVDREEAIDGVDYYVTIGGEFESFWRKNDLAFLMNRSGGVETVRYSPPAIRYAWPLENAKWEQSYRRSVQSGASVSEVTQACEVGAPEDVTVPAGTFRAYKIVCRNQRTKEIMHETWFAPEVKMWVRERGRFSYGIRTRELVSYRLR